MKKKRNSIHIHLNPGIFSRSNKEDIPELPGIYIYKNAAKEILYIGKAKNLRKRVASYFNKKTSQIKTLFLVQEIHIIDILVVDNEKEALLLEISLIKQHLPKFNINFKDGKFYPYLKITIKDKFPRLMVTRNKMDDKNLYFGPYVSASSVRTVLEISQKIFQIRVCKNLPKTACLEYHMQRCSAPCIGKITSKDYQAQVKKNIKFLSGHSENVIKDLNKKMKAASDDLFFEKAQIYKEQIDALRSLSDKQHIYTESEEDIDIIGIHTNNIKGSIVIAQIRKGRLSGKESFIVDTAQGLLSSEHILQEFLLNHITINSPLVLGISEKYHSIVHTLEEWITEEGNPVSLREIGNDDKNFADLLRITEKNAELHLYHTSEDDTNALEILSQVQETLNLTKFPNIIEGFDIAKLSGTLASGVMVQFQKGKPENTEYRMFEIQAENQQDDYESMEEIVYRRYSKQIKEKNILPDLIVIDGGKGHLNSAKSALDKLNLEIDIISIAKQNEIIFHPNNDGYIKLQSNSSVLHMVQRIRDEAHRFSQYYLHKRMDKKLKS